MNHGWRREISGKEWKVVIAQIYEIQDPRQAEMCLQAGVDHVGSVLLGEWGWRHDGVRDVARILEGAGAVHSIIPLFKGDDVYRVLDFYRPAFIHLCDDLTGPGGNMQDLGRFIETQVDLKHRFPEVGVIRSIPVPEPGGPDVGSVEMARRLAPVSDMLLIDTWSGNSPVGGFIGITGRVPEPGISRAVVEAVEIPVILAGGLGPDNVYEAALEVIPAGVDSCTRTNLTDDAGKPVRFKKDFDKVRVFVEETRRAGEDLEGREGHEKAGA